MIVLAIMGRKYAWWFALAAFVGMACAPDLRSAHAIRTVDMQNAKHQVHVDIERGRVGVRAAAQKLARAFRIEVDGAMAPVEPTTATQESDLVARRIAQIRTQLQRFRQPPRGIPELMLSPMSFVCAVSAGGKVLARDAAEDTMAGMDVFATFPEVATAQRAGREWHGIQLYPSANAATDEERTGGAQQGTPMLLHFAPVLENGNVVGGVLAGTPLWRTAQRITRQFHAEHAAEMNRGLIFWAYLYRGTEVHQMGNAPDISSALPSANERQQALERNPGGYITHHTQFGRQYAIGTSPLTELYGPSTGIILVRAD